MKNIDDIHTIDNLAHAHIAQCSAENIMLWCQFIQIFGLHKSSAIVLAKDYHFKRVNNLFFFIRYSLIIYFDRLNDYLKDFFIMKFLELIY